MLELADAVGPNAGLLVDIFHCHCSGTTWETLAAIPGQRIVLAHLNDAPKVPVAQVNDRNRLLPGQGGLDIAGFLAALHKTGYAGPVSLEVFSNELRAMAPADAAKLAGESLRGPRQALEGIFRVIGLIFCNTCGGSSIARRWRRRL